MRKDLHQLFDEFMYESEFVRKVRPETLKGYKQAFNTLLKLSPPSASAPISSHTIALFFKTLQERKRIVGKGTIKTGIKKSTVATYWSKLNSFFAWLKRKNHIQTNPFDDMEYPSPSYEDKKFLKKDEIEKILSAILNHSDNNILLLKRNIVLFYLLLFCGLRKEELMLLQIRDVDVERKLLVVRGEISKSGRIREVPLHSTTVMYLRDYLQERKRYTTQYLIVSSSRDDRLTYDGLKHLIDKIRRRSGVRFHLHQFRHTFAVNFLKTSNNIAKLKQLLGHKDIRMTMTYLRCLPTDEIRGDVEHMCIDNFM